MNRLPERKLLFAIRFENAGVFRQEIFEFFGDLVGVRDAAPIESETHARDPLAADVLIDLGAQGVFKKTNLLHAGRALHPNI